MNRLFKVMPQHLNRIQVRTLTRPLQSLHFVFLQPFRGGFSGVFLDHCPAAEHKFASAWGHEQMAGHCPSGFFGRQQNSWFHLSQQVYSSKTAPDHHTTTTIFYWWYDVLFLKCCVTFTPDVMGHTPSKKFNFCLVSPQSIFPKVLGIIKMFSGKTETSFYVLFAQQRFSSWNSAMQAIFAQSLSYGGVMNTDLNWGLQFFRCCCGVFCDLLDESSLCSWGNFGQPATPGKVHHCSMFSPFVDNGSHCGSLESQSFRNGFITLFQTDRSQLLSFSFVPEFLWISTWCVAFEDILVYFTLSGRSYLCDFLIANRCGSNQAWMWLEKLNSGVIIHSYVLTGGQTLFHTGPCGFGFCFLFIKKTLHLKTARCVYLCYLWLIFKFVWWSETLKCDKHAKKKKKNQEGGQHFFTPLYITISRFYHDSLSCWFYYFVWAVQPN